jgi:tRNA threonylcarbamoyladenosine biosynthesis protein TsaE
VLRAETHSVEETRQLGKALASVLEPGSTLLLVGGLGAGKTALAQGIAAGLGVTARVTSPTFTMVSSYRIDGDGPIRVLLHADLYRTGSATEVDQLAIGELVEDAAVAVVEWGDVAPELLGERRLLLTISTGPGDDDRRFELEPGRFEEASLAAALAPWAAS